MRNLLRLSFLVFFLLCPLACGEFSSPQNPRPAPSVISVNTEIDRSRTNAIVLAAQRVSPAVVSVIVTQTRIVSYDPFGFFGFDDFFRDFFPRHSFRQEVKSMGSGVIVDAKGYVVTNAHVVNNATKIKVTLPDNRTFDAELLALDSDRDLALLKISGENLPVAPLGNSDDLLIGEWAIAIGNPFGFLIEDAQPTVTVGVISALHRDIRSRQGGPVFTDMIQTDAAINPGNSGGPLVNALGEVIGINTFIFSHAGGSEGVGFARPINEVKRFISEALGQTQVEYERVSTKIGAVIADINPTLRSRFGLAHTKGVVVLQVNEGSIAERIGLLPGDVLLIYQGKVVSSARSLKERLERLEGKIDLVIDRKGEQLRILYQLR
ncbi:MAG: trypsin-like peptidase domain-containing protein [candidate division WOR-3 bacterium]